MGNENDLDDKYRRMCYTKIQHPTQKAAVEAARSATRTDRTQFSAYQCPFCGAWHIGHSPKREKWHQSKRRKWYIVDMQKRKRERELQRKLKPKKGQKRRAETGIDDQTGQAQETREVGMLRDWAAD